MKLCESKTYENLAKSFAGECQAFVRYRFIEYGARKEGYEQLAQTIDCLAYQEFNHARMFYTALQDGNKETIDNIDIASGYPFKEKWDLVENLKLASEDEGNEEQLIYPEYMQTAREEGFTDIATLYENIIQVESCHRKLLTDLYGQMKNNSLYKKPKVVKWKCADCGYEAKGKEAWTICPLCKAEQGSTMLKLDNDDD